MKNEIIQFDTPELNGTEKSKAEQIKQTFEPMAKMLTEFEEAYNNIISESQKEITNEVTAKAKRLRLDIGKVRIETEKIRKEQKEEYLRAGKAIDVVSNILKWAISDKEEKLKEIENYFEIQEQKRLQELQNSRAELLSEYIEDAHERDLSKFEEDEFQALLSMKKKEKEDRIEAERIAEQERIDREKAESEERKRLQAENERLLKEAKEREAKEEAERKVREEKEAKERAEFQAKLKAEREEKERVEAELKAKEQAELKAKQEEEERIQSELNKGDSAKVQDLVSELNSLKTKYSFKSAKNKKMYSGVNELIDKVINYIQK